MRRPVLALLRPAVPAAALLLAAAAPYAVQLGAGRCVPLSRPQVAALGPDWLALARYVRRCPVHGPDGRTVLSVDIVRVDQAIAEDYFRTRTTEAVPRPVLRDAAGTAVGELPEGFPADPPGLLRVRFVDWRGGVPHEIRLYEAGVSALAPHALPSLRWNPDTRHYD